MKEIFNLLNFIFIGILIIFLSFPIGYFIFDKKNNLNYEIHKNNSYEGIGTYLINLDRSKERLKHVKNSIEKLGFETQRISAVDGAILSQEEINNKVDISSYRNFLGHSPKLGTIGCSLSHIKVWENFLKSPYKYALVLEDDISFSPEKLRSTIDYLTKDDSSWDITSFELSHSGLPLTLKTFPNNQKLSVYLAEVTHTGAYIINRKAAQKLLEKSLPIKLPIDHYFTRAWEFDLKFTGIENPRIVKQTFESSEISNTNNFSQEKLGFLSRVEKVLYKFQSSTIRFLYNLKVYIENFKL